MTDAPGSEAGGVTPPAVEASELGWRVGKQWVLRGISLRIEAGALVGLAGPNGSGKSALLRLLASLAAPSEGWARVAGFDTFREAPEVRRRIGYLSERASLYGRMTVGQNLDFIAHSHQMAAAARAEVVRTLLEVVGLTPLAGTLVEQLSPGQRRRAALAAALVHDPPVLLLDDPLRGLDGAARLEQLEVLRELREMGKTVMVADNLLADLAALCDEILVLRDGSLGWRGSPDQLGRWAGGEAMEWGPLGAYDQALAQVLAAGGQSRPRADRSVRPSV